MLYHTHTTDEVLAELKTTTKGLHQIYAEERLARYGYNHLRLSRLSLWRIIIEPFRSAMMLILLVALGCTLVAGRYTETVLVALILSLIHI